jgi:membrane protein DedA with SNARE-associated domain
LPHRGSVGIDFLVEGSGEYTLFTSETAEAFLRWLHDHEGWIGPVVFLLSFMESFAFLSIIVPATVILVGVGAMIGAAGLSFLPAYSAAAAGAFFGDWAAFELAVWLGPKLADTWPFSRSATSLKQASEWFARWGMATIFVGRFFGPMRAAVPAVAGILRMPRVSFQMANLASALVWAGGILAPGAFSLR